MTQSQSSQTPVSPQPPPVPPPVQGPPGTFPLGWSRAAPTGYASAPGDVCVLDPTGSLGFNQGGGCSRSADAWGGAWYRTATNQFMVGPGGGHRAWSGNEIYALNLGGSPVAWSRFNNPTSPSTGTCANFNDDYCCYDGKCHALIHESLSPTMAYDRQRIGGSNYNWCKTNHPAATWYPTLDEILTNLPVNLISDQQTGDLFCGPSLQTSQAPQATHSYSQLAYDPIHDLMYMVGNGSGDNGSGIGVARLWVFDPKKPQDQQWTDKGLPALEDSNNPALLPLGASTSGWAGFNPTDQKVYWVSGGSLYVYTPSTNKVRIVGTFSTMAFSAVGGQGAIDPTGKTLYFLGEFAGFHIFHISLDALDSNYGKPIEVSPFPATCSGFIKAAIWEWDDSRGVVTMWPNSGNAIIDYDPKLRKCSTTSFPVADGTSGPAAAVNDIQSRFRKIKLNGQYLFVVAPSGSDAPYILRVR
jgi:hypothetical protein